MKNFFLLPAAATCLSFASLAQSHWSCPSPEGAFACTEDCNAYWACFQSEAFLMRCPPNLNFDPATGVCKDVDCQASPTALNQRTTNGQTNAVTPTSRKYPDSSTNPKCNPATWDKFSFDCCADDSPCYDGEGGCKNDGQCAGDLVCGKGNCPESSDLCQWHLDGCSCCEKPTNPKCNPATWDKFSFECCTDDSPCYDGEGGCKNDDQCAGDLICGKGNCPESSDLCQWHVDGCSCCQKPTNPKCNPATWDKFSFDCCTEDKPCYEGEGQCKNDEQCAGDLVCGKDNCPATFDLCQWHADGCSCCQKPE